MRLIGRAILGAALLLAVPETPAPAQSIDVLRSSGRGIERALRQQIGRALRPELEVRNGFEAPPKAIALARGGSHLAAVTPDGGLRIFDLIDGRQVRAEGPRAGLAEIAMGASGRPVFALGTDGRVSVAEGWQSAPGRPARLASPSRATAIAAGGGLGVVGHGDGLVSLLSGDGALLASARLGSEAVTAVAADPGGDLVLAGDEDGALTAIGRSGASRPVAGAPGDEITAITHLVGPLFGIGTEDGELAFVDAREARVLARWEAHGDDVVAIAALGDRLASADEDGELKLWDGRGRLLREIEPDWDGEITGLAATAGRAPRLIVSGPSDAVHILDPAADAPLASVFLTRRGWGAVDARGRFDGDPSAFQDIAWRAGRLRLPVENLSARYFEPGLIPKHVSGDGRFLTAAREAVAERLFPPPVVSLEVISEPSAPGQPISVEIEAEAARASEISEIRLFHNGKRVAPSALRELSRSGGTVVVSASLPASPGANTLTAVARGWAEIDSVPAIAEVQLADAGGAERLAVTAIGIDRYDGRALRLNYAAADAKAVADQLARRGRRAFGGVETDVVLDRAASRSGIDAALGRLTATAVGDVAVIFLAGHARTVGERWFFLPRELTDLRDDREVSRLGLSGEALADALTSIPARRVLLVVDACQSGAVLGSFEAFGQRRALQELKSRTGVAVIAATRADQLAKEYSALGHGLLTYVFLEGLGSTGRMMADTAPADGRLTAAEMKAYVERRAPELAADLDARIPVDSDPRGEFSQRVPVTPVGVILGGDFALAR